MKLLYFCEKCDDLHRDEADGILYFKDGNPHIIDTDRVPIEDWDKIAADLPGLIRVARAKLKGN